MNPKRKRETGPARAIRGLALGIAVLGLGLMACAGPHGERPALDAAVTRPGSTPYGFSGGYVGATGGSGISGR